MSFQTIRPYLFFNGRCEEALQFYKEAIGAKIGMVLHFNESPDPVPPGILAPGFESKVMHSEFTVGGSSILASDGCDANSTFDGFQLNLTVKTVEEANRSFAALSAGGEVRMPMGKTFWSPCYGMLTDKFGVGWMVMVPAE